MHVNSLKNWLPTLVLGLLLLVLATLQYRWIGEVSVAEQARLQDSVERSAATATRQFDSQITSLLLSVGPATPEDLAVHLDQWRKDSSNPALLEAVMRLRLTPPNRRQSTPIKPRATIERFNSTGGLFEPTEWTARWRPLLRLLGPAYPGPERFRQAGGEIEPTLPALVVRWDRPRRRSFSGDQRRSILVLVLNREELVREVRAALFPQLEQAIGDDFAFRVVDGVGEVVAATDQAWPPNGETLKFDLLRLRAPDSLRPDLVKRILGRYRARGMPDPPWARKVVDGVPSGPDFAQSGAWSLEIAHRRGTLKAAVAQIRLRNLGINAAILGLLAITVIVLLRSADRARQLAESQLDFVAGLTHELHTPLAAITSAGANLADGIVSQPQRVRDYGKMLEREGARLNDLVGQALHLAGVESSTLKATESLNVELLLREALERAALIAKEADVHLALEVTQSADRPLMVKGEQEALLRALANLLSNATKYGATEVTLTAQSNGAQVTIQVTDNGPGINEHDRARLFEPYVRGENSKVPGTGLGLYLAQRIAEKHGGRLRYAGPGSSFIAGEIGAVFELSLPRACPPTATETSSDLPRTDQQ